MFLWKNSVHKSEIHIKRSVQDCGMFSVLESCNKPSIYWILTVLRGIVTPPHPWFLLVHLVPTREVPVWPPYYHSEVQSATLTPTRRPCLRCRQSCSQKSTKNVANFHPIFYGRPLQGCCFVCCILCVAVGRVYADSSASKCHAHWLLDTTSNTTAPQPHFLPNWTRMNF